MPHCRHEDHRQEQHQHHRTAARRHDGTCGGRDTSPNRLYRLHHCAAHLFCPPASVLCGCLEHCLLCLALCRRPCAARDDCIVRRYVVSWSNTHDAHGLGHDLSALWGRTALDRCALIAFMRRGRCASTVGRWRYNVPLRCSFLGKVPPIGGFCVLYGFLPPTLLRGGICAFCTSAILRRNGPVSDFISCSGLYRRKGIFHRRVDENTFRTDPHICRAVTSYHIFFTLSQLSSVVLYHAPRGIRRPSRTPAHSFLHAVGSITHRVAAFRLFLFLPLIHILFQNGFRVLGCGVLQLCLGRVHAGSDLQVPHGVSPHRAWLTLVHTATLHR